MIPSCRQWFNKNFTEEKYRQLVKATDEEQPGALDFRIAETPVFVDKVF